MTETVGFGNTDLSIVEDHTFGSYLGESGGDYYVGLGHNARGGAIFVAQTPVLGGPTRTQGDSSAMFRGTFLQLEL